MYVQKNFTFTEHCPFLQPSYPCAFGLFQLFPPPLSFLISSHPWRATDMYICTLWPSLPWRLNATVGFLILAAPGLCCAVYTRCLQLLSVVCVVELCSQPSCPHLQGSNESHNFNQWLSSTHSESALLAPPLANASLSLGNSFSRIPAVPPHPHWGLLTGSPRPGAAWISAKVFITSSDWPSLNRAFEKQSQIKNIWSRSAVRLCSVDTSHKSALPW